MSYADHPRTRYPDMAKLTATQRQQIIDKASSPAGIRREDVEEITGQHCHFWHDKLTELAETVDCRFHRQTHTPGMQGGFTTFFMIPRSGRQRPD